MRKNESCRINLRNILSDSVFCAASESVFSLWLQVLFEFENHSIPPKTAVVPVKLIFLDQGKKRTRNFVTDGMVNRMR
jgi:hypothetical protein